jgi:2-polyprenyl-3-methyl-5-hydroxy-6-metoxy-1,4-benzoquinol methylase
MNKKAHWERIYHDRTPCEVSWYQSETELSLKMIQNAGTPKDASIIDVGGGASILVKNLHGAGYGDLTVLDISERGIAYAKDQMGEDADRIHWIEDDIMEFSAPKLYDIWHDRAVFHFLIKKDNRAKYVETLKRTLTPGGTIILASFAVGGPVRCSGIDIVQYDAEKLLGELGSEFTLVEEAVETHLTPGNREQKFSYFRCTYNL